MRRKQFYYNERSSEAHDNDDKMDGCRLGCYGILTRPYPDPRQRPQQPPRPSFDR